MRTAPVLAVAIVTALGTSVLAEPAASPPRDDLYVAASLTLGVYDQLYMAGPTLEAGVRYRDSPLWFHGAVGGGTATELLVSGTGDYLRASAGVEARACAYGGELCASGGADLGYMHGSFSGMYIGFLGGNGTMQTDSENQLAAIPHGALEVALTVPDHDVRLRLTVDAPIDLAGRGTAPNAGILTSLGLVYGW